MDLQTAGREAQVVQGDVSVLALSYGGLYDKPVVALVVSVQPDVGLQPDVVVLTRGVLGSPELLSLPHTKTRQDHYPLVFTLQLTDSLYTERPPTERPWR